MYGACFLQQTSLLVASSVSLLSSPMGPCKMGAVIPSVSSRRWWSWNLNSGPSESSSCAFDSAVSLSFYWHISYLNCATSDFLWYDTVLGVRQLKEILCTGIWNSGSNFLRADCTVISEKGFDSHKPRAYRWTVSACDMGSLAALGMNCISHLCLFLIKWSKGLEWKHCLLSTALHTQFTKANSSSTPFVLAQTTSTHLDGILLPPSLLLPTKIEPLHTHFCC